MPLFDRPFRDKFDPHLEAERIVRELKIEKLKSSLLKVFGSIADPSLKEAVFRELAIVAGCSDLLKPPRPVELPASAPALWINRTDKQQTPPDFIGRTYEEWLGKGLTRAHILHLDKPLYSALAKWLLTNKKMPADVDLPTKPEQNTRDLQAAAEQPGSIDPKERLRLQHVAQQRQRQAEPPTFR